MKRSAKVQFEPRAGQPDGHSSDRVLESWVMHGFQGACPCDAISYAATAVWRSPIAVPPLPDTVQNSPGAHCKQTSPSERHI
jgi:hypothetical protein